MRSYRKLVCLVLISSCLSIFIGCFSDEEDQNFTGTFKQTLLLGWVTYTEYLFVLSQNEDQLEGTYAKNGLAAGLPFSYSYHVSGTVITSEVAELSLILTQSHRPDFSEPPTTVHAVLKNHGDLLYIHEWNLDVPRVD